jgi:hypothetical protein
MCLRIRSFHEDRSEPMDLKTTVVCGFLKNDGALELDPKQASFFY